MIQTSPPLHLASSSSSRRKLLKSTGIQFSFGGVYFDEKGFEEEHSSLSCCELSLSLARAKAKKALENHQEKLVLALDQVGEYDHKILRKPKNVEACINQLYAMQGQWHSLHNGWVLASADKIIGEGIVSARLQMRNLSKEQITWYVKNEMPLDSCGGYYLEGLGRLLFSKVEGGFEEVLGLPVQNILDCLLEQKLLQIPSPNRG